MNPNRVRERLESFSDSKLFEDTTEKISKDLRDAKLEVWLHNDRVMVMKDYTSENHLFDWKRDQVTISFVLEELQLKFRNNLYFLIVLNWEGIISEKVLVEVTEIEKNDKVCRKYVLSTEDDLNRVPFLRMVKPEGPFSFNYDEQFKQKIVPDQTHTKVTELINHYFDSYDVKEEDRTSRALEIVRGRDKQNETDSTNDQ